jgi:surface carbohydrate biosynthesis protein (TIGR04326 family)
MKIDWELHKDSTDSISIISFIEENDFIIREIFNDLIKSISDIRLGIGNLENHFRFGENYNLWLMSNISEKSFYKTPEIFEGIKLLALKLILEKTKTDKLFLINAPKEINSTIKIFCKKNKIFFNKLHEKTVKNKVKWHSSFLLTKSIIWILNIFIDKVKNSLTNNKNWLNGENVILSIGYFSHLGIAQINKGIFSSGIWGDLPNLFQEYSKGINFLHHFIPSKATRSRTHASKLLKKINKNNNQSHNFIFSFLTFRNLIKCICAYISFIPKSNKIIKLISNHLDDESGLYLSSIFLKSIKKSIRGIVLIENIFWCVQFDHILKKIPHQEKGFFLMENQGWELAFVNAWKKYNHGNLYAVQNSMVSFWDLRYFNPYKANDFYSKPDYFLVNGKSAFNHFVKFNYPKNKIRHIEAFRYIDLKQKLNKNHISYNRVLVLGNVIPSSTNQMLECLKPIIGSRINKKFDFKPHPANEINIDLFDKKLNIVNGKLIELIRDYQTVICPSSSAAAVESFLMGLKTIIYLEKGSINTSPLRNNKNVFFVSSSMEIKNALEKSKSSLIENDFLNLDIKTPRIRKILSN